MTGAARQRNKGLARQGVVGARQAMRKVRS